MKKMQIVRSTRQNEIHRYDASAFLGNFSSGVAKGALEERKKRLDLFLQGYKHAGDFSGAKIDAVNKVFIPFRRIFNPGNSFDPLHFVGGNNLRNNMIAAVIRR